MLQLPHHQDLNMPPNFPMSNDSGFHETDSPKAPPPHHDSGSPDPGYAEMGGSSPDSLMDSGNAGEHDNYDEILSNPINTRNDIGISDQELVTMSTKEINKLVHTRRACGRGDVGTCPHQVLAVTLTLSQPWGADYAHPILVSTPNSVATFNQLHRELLKKSGIPKERQKELKEERRTLKNRGYAAVCRVKREDEEKTLEKKNDLLKHNIKLKLCEIEEAKRETEQLKLSYKYVCEQLQKEQKEHETYLMKIEEDKAKQGQELGVKNLLANRTEIKWEKVKEEPTSSIFLNKM